MSQEHAIEAPCLLAEQRDAALWLTLNRPGQRNPLSSQMIAALTTAIDAANDDPSVRVIVIQGKGPVFSAGHDLREMQPRDGEDPAEHEARIRRVLTACARMMTGIVPSPNAIIASVSACDLAIASDQAAFCTPGVNIGSFCTTPLVGIGRNMHRKHAMELALTGDMFSAEDAFRFGLVNRVVPAAALEQATRELVDKIAARSAQGIRAGKEAFYRQIEMPLEEAFVYAGEEMLKAMTTRESHEGVSAFLEKRAPRWGEA